jgi:hypothetical protein
MSPSRRGSSTRRLDSVQDHRVEPINPCRNGSTRSAGGGHAPSSPQPSAQSHVLRGGDSELAWRRGDRYLPPRLTLAKFAVRSRLPGGRLLSHCLTGSPVRILASVHGAPGGEQIAARPPSDGSGCINPNRSIHGVGHSSWPPGAPDGSRVKLSLPAGRGHVDRPQSPRSFRSSCVR